MKIDFEKAKIDPASVFERPFDVLKNQSLTRAQKIEILRRWAYDEREISVAEEENMQYFGTKQVIFLEEILLTLLQLGVESDQDASPPTKQGG